MNGLLPFRFRQRGETIPAQRKPFEAYLPPACAKYLTRQERDFIDELIRLLTQ